MKKRNPDDMLFWEWLFFEHPIVFEMIWCVVSAMALAAIIISIISITKG